MEGWGHTSEGEAMTEPREQLHEIREEADRVQQFFERATPAARDHEGEDSLGAVSVNVDSKGGIRGILIAPDWDLRVQPGDLGTAVAEAVMQATVGTAEDWVENLEVQSELPEPQTRPMPQNIEDYLATLPPDEPVTEAVVLERISPLWSEAIAEMDYAQASVEGFAERTFHSRTHGGEVAVTVLVGGAVGSIELNEAWLGRTHVANIGRVILTTLQEAQQQAFEDMERLQSASDAAVSGLSKFTDPTVLMRRIGLDV